MTGRIVALEDAYQPPPARAYTFDPSFDEMAGYRNQVGVGRADAHAAGAHSSASCS